MRLYILSIILMEYQYMCPVTHGVVCSKRSLGVAIPHCKWSRHSNLITGLTYDKFACCRCTSYNQRWSQAFPLRVVIVFCQLHWSGWAEVCSWSKYIDQAPIMYKDGVSSYVNRMDNSMFKERRPVGRIFFNMTLPIMLKRRIHTSPQFM